MSLNRNLFGVVAWKRFEGFKQAIKSIFGKGDSNFLSVFKPHRFSAEQVERVFWFD